MASHKYKQSITDQIPSLYLNGGLSGRVIADKLGIGYSLVFHYLRKHNIQLRSKSEALNLAFQTGRATRASGKKHWNWKGGTYKQNGYTFVKAPGHPRARNGYVAEHVIVWEQANGQYVPPGHLIHHLDGNKQNNDISNLELVEWGKHSGDKNTIMWERFQGYKKELGQWRLKCLN